MTRTQLLNFLDWLQVGLTLTMGAGALMMAVTLVGCALLPPKPVEPPAPPQAVEACDAFCVLYVELGCDDTGDSPGADGQDGTADDVPCAQVCEDEVEAGAYAPDTTCLETATTCDGAEACVFGDATAQTPRQIPQEPPRGPESQPAAGGQLAIYAVRQGLQGAVR